MLTAQKISLKGLKLNIRVCNAREKACRNHLNPERVEFITDKELSPQTTAK